jgi:hypothetical protein
VEKTNIATNAYCRNNFLFLIQSLTDRRFFLAKYFVKTAAVKIKPCNFAPGFAFPEAGRGSPAANV